MKARLVIEMDLDEISGKSYQDEADMIIQSPHDFLDGDDITVTSMIVDDNNEIVSYSYHGKENDEEDSDEIQKLNDEISSILCDDALTGTTE